MQTPAPHLLARMALALSGAVCVIGMVGPFQGVEEALIPWDKAAHFLAFYGLTSLLFLSFPRRRRVDLAFLAALGGASIELAQGLTGRDFDAGDMMANALGAGFVLAATFIEPLRARSRSPHSFRPERRRKRIRDVSQTAARVYEASTLER
jgi:VanZ family protein